MRKLVISALAILLTLTMAFGFAACKDKPEDPTEPTTVDDTIDVVVTDPVVDTTDEVTDTTEDTGEETTEDTGEETTEADPSATTKEGDTEASTKAPDNKYAPPANLGSLSQAEQLAYFNLVTSRVRAEKPGFVRTEQLKIADMSFTGVVSLAQSLINSVVEDLMPGDLITETVAKGADNKDNKFMSENANPSELRAQDINSIKSTKSGDNWIIEVSVKESVNPAKNMGSTVGRIAVMQTREEIFESISDSAGGLITADTNNATVRYHTIYARVTVNAQGQIIEASNGFDVAASATGVKMLSIITTNAAFAQTSRWTYKNFKW